MNFQQAIDVIATHTQISDLAPDADGLVQLQFDESLTLTAFSPADSEALYLAASLLEVPEVERAAFYERLLQLNFLLMETRGATLSLDEQARQVHLCLCLPFETLDEVSLGHVLSGFLDTAIRLQAELVTVDGSAPTPSGMSPLAPLGFHRA